LSWSQRETIKLKMKSTESKDPLKRSRKNSDGPTSQEQSIQRIDNPASQAVHAESAPAPFRRYRAIMFQATLITTAAAFAVLTCLVTFTDSFQTDLTITRTIQLINFPFFETGLHLISWIGFYPQIAIITVLIGFVVYGLGLHWEAVMVVAGAVISAAINIMVKDIIQRPRPSASMVSVFAPLSSYSFPSGHVMYFLGVFGFLMFLAFSLLKPSLKQSLILIFFGIPISLIGVSRVYLGQHWASDVLGSYLLGSLSLVLIIQIYRWGKSRFFVQQPKAANGA